MDDPWRHIPSLDAAPRRRHVLPQWAVAPLLLISILLLALMPIVIIAVVLLSAALW